MSQSTMVDSAGSRDRSRATPGQGRPQAAGRSRTAAAPPDFECALKVLEHCGRATTLSDFKIDVVESLARVLGLRDVSFFAGPTFGTTFSDRSPVLNGKTALMFPEYREDWWQYDIFGTPAATRLLVSKGMVTAGCLAHSGPALSPSATAYLTHFIHRRWHFTDGVALRLDLHGMHTGMVGIFTDEPVPARTAATLGVISRQLSAVARGIPFVSVRDDFDRLTQRQRDVAVLVAQGFSNAQIAETLTLAEDSVKKYVSRILAATGCSTRMELALTVRGSLRLP